MAKRTHNCSLQYTLHSYTYQYFGAWMVFLSTLVVDSLIIFVAITGKELLSYWTKDFLNALN